MCVKTWGYFNLHYGLTHNLWERAPDYLKVGYDDTEAAKKLPPGQLLHLVELGVVVVGVLGAIVETRWRKQKVQ